MLLSQFPLTFQQIHNEMLRFIALLMTFIVLIGTVFSIIYEMFNGRISFNSAFIAASEFREKVQVRIDVYIPH